MAERAARARDGARAVRDDLAALLARAERAFAAAPPLAGLPAATAFERLADLRRDCGVDGLLWEDPGGTEAWDGRPLPARPLPAPSPWERSFRSGGVQVHRGPFLEALIVGPRAHGGGFLSVTLLLAAGRPQEAAPPFADRWLGPLGLAAVDLLPPPAPAASAAAPEGEARERLDAADGTPLLEIRARAPGPEATRDRLEARRRAREGLALLAGLLLAGIGAFVLLARGAPAGPARALGSAAVLLLLRGGLAALDLPGRFAGLAPAFSPTDFGIEDPLGWLASPGDFALTALTLLGVAGLAADALREAAVRRPRAVSLPGLLLAAAAALGAAAALHLAVAQGQTPFFQSLSFVPPLPVALMLVGLVSTTAGALLLASAGLTAARGARGGRAGALRGVAAAALAAGLALALAGGRAACLLGLVPAVALLPLRLREGPGRELGASRVLLVGLLSTLTLFPALWAEMGVRRQSQLSFVLDRLEDHEGLVQSELRSDLEELAQDPRLLAALRAARGGPRPEGLALTLWLDTVLARPDVRGSLAVLDERGRLLDEFSLEALPRRRMPVPVGPSGPHDVQVLAVRADAVSLRTLVGRVRVRGSPAGGEGREVLGHVVLSVPDPADLLLAGVPAGARLLPEDGSLLGGRRPLEVALLVRGRVVASSAPDVSREPGSFGPEALAGLSAPRPRLAWDGPAHEGVAAWSESRAAVLAVRRRTTDLGDVVLALSRLLVVGLALSLAVALGAFAAAGRRFRLRLHHRILLSYVVISVVPLVLLAWANVTEARARHDERFMERLETDLSRARGELEAQGPQVFDLAGDEALRRGAWDRRHDLVLYRGGRAVASSRRGLLEAEVEPERLPAEAYRATALERRQTIRREPRPEGRAVWIGYAPVLAADGRVEATVAVPLPYDTERVDEELTVTGSVMLAGYLLTLVLVLATSIYAARLIARPIDVLARGTEQVARGDLGVVLPGEGPDELGQVVAAFNQMTRALAEARARAAQAEREAAWRRMARQVAHEIKNPLSPMKLMVQQMEADLRRDPGRAGEAVPRTAAVLLRQIDALARIAGTFGELARLPARRPTDVDVAALVAHVVDLHAGARAQGIEVRAELEPDLPRVTADEEELRRVLVNVVGNAVQAIPGAGRVLVRARRAPAPDGAPGVAVEVADTGVGIPPEHRARLFEPYFSTKTSGTGLGLAIVKRILDDLGGSIRVESVPGQGTTVHLWCPLTPAPTRPPAAGDGA